MPSPGDLLTTNYQFQLDENVSTQLYGAGSNGVLVDLNAASSFLGFGVPEAKIQDVVYAGKAGAFANPDFVSTRIITIPVILRGDAATVMTSYKALVTAWVPLATDVTLAFQLPGWNKFYVSGRPRGLKDDLSAVQFGAVRALLRFDCPDPTIHFI